MHTYTWRIKQQSLINEGKSVYCAAILKARCLCLYVCVYVVNTLHLISVAGVIVELSSINCRLVNLTSS